MLSLLVIFYLLRLSIEEKRARGVTLLTLMKKKEKSALVLAAKDPTSAPLPSQIKIGKHDAHLTLS
ncbi:MULTISPECIES: hypothetical protein [Pantoea]|uniref:Uncharacterized protein n=1 Tax=Pantoea trifolii TaxID=2968030 RepID=A0ABT1VLP2_9GAMM|nr:MULTISPECIES: hypothetical protein [unclassified Pantoea]MCQ8228455.1 hypothetical protein [Pantoea sp. MMK2]MCQ8236629.1 hypothetical protein [Pantoea sp. MMK3]MCW6032671.1 hypothetical protein [Pantoea sp. JK]